MRGKRLCFRPVAANQSDSLRRNSSFVSAEVNYGKRLMLHVFGLSSDSYDTSRGIRCA